MNSAGPNRALTSAGAIVLAVGLLVPFGAWAGEPAERVTVYAAASTSDVMGEVLAAFHDREGIAVTTSFGASSTLAQQIDQGAPADLFLSAAAGWGDFLAKRGEVAERVDLLANRLVIVTPPDNPAGVRGPADLAGPSVQRLALGDPGHVPAGQYAREALTRLGLWERVRGRVVAADDVREALALVARGEAQAGLVYATDAAVEPGVKVAASLDPGLHGPVRYPLVLLKRAGSKPEARRLYAFLQSGEAAALFRKAGFTVLTSSEPGEASGPARPPVAPGRPAGLSAAEWTAIGLSLWVSAWSVVISLPFGVALGYWLARTRSNARAAVETVVNLPLVLPPVVTGYLLLVVLGTRGWVGGPLDRAFGLQIAFTWKAAALASAVVSFPLMVRAMRLAFQGVDARLEQAARTLGARPLDAFLTVSLPLARNGLIAACVLAFARSLGEFGATIMFAGNVEGQTQTIPVAIYTLVHQPGGIERSGRLVLVSVAIAALALVVGEYLERKGARREPA